MLNLKAIIQQSKEIFSKIKDIVLEHKIHSMLILLLLCLLLLLIMLVSSPKKTEVPENVYPFDLIHSYELPIETEDESYYYSRDTKKSWSKDDALDWFSDPDGLLLNELEGKNTKKVTDILEASP
jgi:hypothetical protein